MPSHRTRSLSRLILALTLPCLAHHAAGSQAPWNLMNAMPADVEAEAPWIRPAAFQAAQMDDLVMREELAKVPMEVFPFPKDEGILFSLPHPDGGFTRFRLVESPVMEPGLAARFPDIKTYRGQGVDDPAANVRLDITPQGFHAMVLTPQGDYFIDPYSKGDVNHYAVYRKRDLRPSLAGAWGCGVTEHRPMDEAGYGERNSGGTLKTYRLAVAATGEFTAYHGGTVALGQAAIVTAVNRVTGLYERDLAIRLVLVANNSNLVYINASTDPYTNNSGSTMLGENQTTVTSVIGSANYDIGHVFSTGGGGVAQLGCVCTSGSKARGVTGSPAPTGDAFWIDYVAHEMGHQFGGNHSFNGTGGSCAGGNRNAATAYEPGSGTTIMGYAGICGAADDLQSNSDAIFHHNSYAEIRAFIAAGGSCGGNSATGNSVPTVNGGTDYTIPKGTAFTLTTISASDANGDALTYSWEQRDLGAAQSATATDNGTSPIFRCWNATTSNARTFPRYADVLDGGLVIGEQYPSVARTLDARVTVRDNRSGGGGVIEDDVIVNINGTAGPFTITSPNTNVTWSGTQTVTWNVAGTNAAPVSTANVRILLSTDGGQTWPTVLAATTPNDGTEAVTLPSVSSTSARIRVEAVGNIYFDVSNVNFTLQGPPPPAAPTNVAATPSSICGSSPVTLTGTVPAGIAIDWYGGSCGGTLVGTGASLVVTPAATTSYFARARDTSTGAVSTACTSTTVTVTGSAPAAPTGVAASDSTLCSSTTVTFTGSVGASSYQVFRSPTNDFATATQIGTPAASPFQDTTVTPGVPHYYWVKAVGGCGASPASASDVGTRRSVPSVPTGVTATDATTACGTVSIAWTASSGATGYQIFRNTVNDPNTSTQVVAASASPATDTTAPANTTLFYWVRASNTCGASALGGGDAGSALGIPTAPSGVSAADGTSCNGIAVTWNAAPGAADYRVWRNTSPTITGASLLGTVTATAFDDTTASAGVTFHYFIDAGNACGRSPAGGPDAGTRGAGPSFTLQPADATVDEGQTATFTAQASGGGAVYQWRFGGVPVVNNPPRITGAQTGTLTINSVMQSDAGQYDATASTACGTATSTAATLTVNAGIPCPADFNMDGGVDGGDVADFFAAWESADPSADVNQDGGIDGGDIGTFYDAWSAGGC
ncbi:MAG: reprolysin-like metallopeptidase [Phycisphaerae bacterium]